MITLKKKTATAKKAPQDFLALDFGASGIKAVRVKKVNGTPTVVAADILPPVRMDASPAEEGRKPVQLAVSKALLANYAAIAYSGERALIRVVTMPGHSENAAETEQTLREHIGLDKSFRVAHVTMGAAKGKDTRVLAVAVPDADAQAILARVGVGAPAPYSFEISGLAAMNACLMGPAAGSDTDAICVVESGAQVSVMAIFNKGSLVLARKLEVGGHSVLTHIQKQFGVDFEMARSILTEGAFDISEAVKLVIEPFARQLTISRDFVERQENCRISGIFMSGGMCLSAGWVKEIERAAGMPVRIWNPFAAATLAPGALPRNFVGQETRFAAAMGAAMGVMDAS